MTREGAIELMTTFFIKVGVPAGICVLVLGFCGYSFDRVYTTILLPVGQKHILFLEKTAETQQRQAIALEAVAEGRRDQLEILNDIAEGQKEIKMAIDKMASEKEEQ